MKFALKFIDRVKNVAVMSGYDGYMGNSKEVRYFTTHFDTFDVSLCRFVCMQNGERLLCVRMVFGGIIWMLRRLYFCKELCKKPSFTFDTVKRAGGRCIIGARIDIDRWIIWRVCGQGTWIGTFTDRLKIA